MNHVGIFFFLSQASAFLKNLFDSALTGDALDATAQFRTNHTPNGTYASVKIIETYGRTPGHTDVIPYISEWSQGTLDLSWAEYKKNSWRATFF